MADGDRALASGVLIRLPGLVRVAFYAVAISSALTAVLATNATDETGDSLMVSSWYLLMLSFALFALMVLVNFLAAQKLSRRGARDRTR